ncbi:hypothetical protein H5410_058800 [Solanum commersonii]|uniref:Uncharacterized protein n=1 Tax=Solanum commersonii TaxID=4109 RepID=A0A9J5WSK0_SOLCO|nr:hypothetical protein H5410_058800 [Solanum commersonii]
MKLIWRNCENSSTTIPQQSIFSICVSKSKSKFGFPNNQMLKFKRRKELLPPRNYPKQLLNKN